MPHLLSLMVHVNSRGCNSVYIVCDDFTLLLHCFPSSAESGFNHVEPEKYEPRLLHFKGLRVCHMVKVVITIHLSLCYECW